MRGVKTVLKQAKMIDSGGRGWVLRGDSRITLCGSHGGVENMGIGSKYTCFRNTKAHLTLALELEKLPRFVPLESVLVRTREAPCSERVRARSPGSSG